MSSLKICAAVLLAHSWYPSECCNGSDVGGDCHPVPCSEITESWAEGSLRWHKFTFMPSTIRDSLDSQCHVCADERISSEWRGYCVFLPKAAS